MKYDFKSIIDRKGKYAIAVDVLPNLLGPNNPIQVRTSQLYRRLLRQLSREQNIRLTDILRQEMSILTASSDGMR